MRMDPPLKVAMLLLLFRYAYASQFMDDFGQCEKVVKEWAFSSVEQDAKEDKHTLEDLLFFLHVPRTGGRTYHHCFLRKLYPNYQECPRSYDRLRFDPSKKECRLLVTHDDYSMMSKLPRERTSVVTILRNPVDRVFSTYEFSIEVAARFLIHPNISSAKQMTRRVRIRPGAVSTLDIWPWKYLVPWMREDLFSRREARESDGLRIMSSDPYNMKEIVMPLHEYINDPIAHDVVHNGATFQVAGLTNNSYAPEAHKVRHCVQKYKSLSEDVLMVAKKRLDDMLYVGLTENHKESATMFANVVGAQVISQASASNSSSESTMDKGSEHRSSVLESEPETDDHQVGLSDQKTTEAAPEGNLQEEKETMTVEKLMTAYEGCINTLRKTQSRRRTSSLKKIAPANFSKQDRLQVSERVIEEIKALNDLDLELYKYAVNLFAKQHEQMGQKLADIESWEGGFFRDRDVLMSWKILVSVVTPVAFLLVLLFYFVNSRRRMFKIKI